MAASSLLPANGAVAIQVNGTNLAQADFNAFTITATQSTENVTAYDASRTCSKNAMNGTPDFDFSITAFAQAHSTYTIPGVATPSSTTSTTTIMRMSGNSTTITLDSGCTYAATLLINRATIGHGRMRAAVPYDLSAKNQGEVTEAWQLT